MARLIVAGFKTLLFDRDGTPLITAGLRPAAWGWRPLLTGTLVGALALLVPAGVLLMTGRASFEGQPAEVLSWSSATRQTLFLLAPFALLEEVALRGYPLVLLRNLVGAPAAVALTSSAFGLLHMFNPGATPLSIGIVTLAGIFLATVRLSTDSLIAAWLAHLAWNFSQAAILHAPVSGLVLPTPGYRWVDQGPAWLTGGGWGPEGGVAAAMGMLLATFLLVLRPGVFASGAPGSASRSLFHSVENARHEQ